MNAYDVHKLLNCLENIAMVKKVQITVNFTETKNRPHSEITKTVR